MTYISESVWVMIASLIITIALVVFLNFVAKKTNNMVIKADALHYKTDIFSTAAVLIALGLVSYTGEEIIDSILGIAISIYMIYSSLPIIKEGILMLLDAALNDDDIQKIKDIIESESAVTDYHYLQTRESGSHIFVSVHAVFNVSISLYDAHVIGDRIELKVKDLFDGKSVHTLVHMDPYDDSEMNEMEDNY